MRIWRRTKSYWYEFVFEGRRIRASSKQGDKEAAKKIASAHMTRLAEGRAGLAKRERLAVNQLLDRLEAKYKLKGQWSPQNRSMVKHVREEFGKKQADELTAEQVARYVERRLSEGYKAATVNRATEVLRAAYLHAERKPPKITRLEEHNTRTGFFTREQFDTLRSHLPEDLQDLALFAYLTGMRSKEVRSLAWADVTDNNVIRLRGENAKTGKPRRIVVAGELVGLMERRRAARAVKVGDGFVMARTIFHRGGEPVGEFKKSWATAAVAAGLGKMVCPGCKSEGAARWCKPCKRQARYRGAIFHDLRRSGVRNLIRAGVPQTVAMQISGHRTVSVFQRYDIGSEEDLANAMIKLAEQSSAVAQSS